MAVDAVQGHIDAELQRAAGMPFTYYQMLSALADADGQCLRMSALAEVCGSSRSRLSHAANRMEAQGWIVRNRGSVDRRGTTATLSAAGSRALEAARPHCERLVEEAVLSVLNGEQLTALDGVADALRSAACRPS